MRTDIASNSAWFACVTTTVIDCLVGPEFVVGRNKSREARRVDPWTQRPAAQSLMTAPGRCSGRSMTRDMPDRQPAAVQFLDSRVHDGTIVTQSSPARHTAIHVVDPPCLDMSDIVAGRNHFRRTKLAAPRDPSGGLSDRFYRVRRVVIMHPRDSSAAQMGFLGSSTCLNYEIGVTRDVLG